MIWLCHNMFFNPPPQKKAAAALCHFFTFAGVMKKIAKPHYSEHALYYETYLNKVGEPPSILDEMKRNGKAISLLFKSCTEAQLQYAYAPGKWTMKDILMHLIDVERVFLYRAMRFARKDKTALPFFDENEYAAVAQANKISTAKLLKEYNATRASTLAFFNNLTVAQLKEKGVAGHTPTSVRACAWIIYAHEVHHWSVIKEKYLPQHEVKEQA